MNTTTIEIFHNTAQSSTGRWVGLSGYQPGHPVSQVFTFTLPADEPTDVHALAEHAFRVGNGADRLSGAYYRSARRSMSVGDPVRLNGLVWLSCESAGFSLLTHWPLITHIRPGKHDIPADDTTDITEPAAAADATGDVLAAVRVDQPVASAWAAVNRYGADLERLRQMIITEAADDIGELISGLPALRIAALECSQTATRAREELFQALLTARRIEALQARHECGRDRRADR